LKNDTPTGDEGVTHHFCDGGRSHAQASFGFWYKQWWQEPARRWARSSVPSQGKNIGKLVVKLA
jgi:hypothetical protein